MKRLFAAFKVFFRILAHGDDGAVINGALAHTNENSSLSRAGTSHDVNDIETGGEADSSHLRLLALLQQEARFIDFIQEDLSQCSDDEIGAVAKQVQFGCKKILDTYISISPVIEQEEGSAIILAAGFNPMQYKLVGKLPSEAPYHGIVCHGGWKANKLSLPTSHGLTRGVLLPAEVELASPARKP
jgi:hypothetical protein